MPSMATCSGETQTRSPGAERGCESGRPRRSIREARRPHGCGARSSASIDHDDGLVVGSHRVAGHDDHVLGHGAFDVRVNEEADGQCGVRLGRSRGLRRTDPRPGRSRAPCDCFEIDLTLRCEPSRPRPGPGRLPAKRARNCDGGAVVVAVVERLQRKLEVGELLIGDGQTDLGVVDGVEGRDRTVRAAIHELTDVDGLVCERARRTGRARSRCARDPIRA